MSLWPQVSAEAMKHYLPVTPFDADSFPRSSFETPFGLIELGPVLDWNATAIHNKTVGRVPVLKQATDVVREMHRRRIWD